jgi:hypothetical protein
MAVHYFHKKVFAGICFPVSIYPDKYAQFIIYSFSKPKHLKKCSFFLAIIIVTALFFVSCKGDEGPQGLVGPAGPQSNAGPAGSANVIYSPWFGPSFNGSSAWIGSAFAGVQTNYINYAAAPVTQALIDQGTILVHANLQGYASLGNANSITQLPFTYMSVVGGVNHTETWSHNMTVGNMRINFQTTYGWTPPAMSTT